MNKAITITEEKGQLVVTSRQVAENFEKDHSKVNRDIENLIEGIAKNGDTYNHLFIESEYQNEQNKQWYKEYLLTRDGFSLLVMGFNGPKALEWKLKYIEAFNNLEKVYKENLIKLQGEAYKEIAILKLEIQELKSKLPVPPGRTKYNLNDVEILNFINDMIGYGELIGDIHYKINDSKTRLMLDIRKIQKVVKINYPENEQFKAPVNRIIELFMSRHYCLEVAVIEKLLNEKTYDLEARHVILLDVDRLESMGIYISNLY